MTGISTSASASTPPLLGRRIQIAGSANVSTDATLAQYSHDFVAALTRRIMEAGGGIVVGIGKEPRTVGAAIDAPSLTFDWTAIEAAADCLRRGFGQWPSRFGKPIVFGSSEKAEAEIPDTRRILYEEMLASARVHVESIMAGSRAAAFMRQRQAMFGDALIILGGGTGVEHLADLYLARRKPVLPLDIPIGASRDDGTGGAARLAKQSRTEPSRFIRFAEPFVGNESAALASITMRTGGSTADVVAIRCVEILAQLKRPDAFYVRLLNSAHPSFIAVESFFREVVDDVVNEAGFHRIEMGTDKSAHAFINVGIFESLHFSSMAIVDVTGERPNCFIELGYALGTANRVLVTAEEGTKLPFDQQAIPCHFWKAGDPAAKRKQDFAEFWEKHLSRPPIVKAQP